MPRDVVRPAALVRSFFPRRPLDDEPWTLLSVEDFYHRSTAQVVHNVTGERFEVVVRRIHDTTHVPFQRHDVEPEC